MDERQRALSIVFYSISIAVVVDNLALLKVFLDEQLRFPIRECASSCMINGGFWNQENAARTRNGGAPKKVEDL